MGGQGWQNPYPFQLGGGETRTESVYKALRRNVGVGGAGPLESIEDLWRIAKAQAIAASMSQVERAFTQAFPNLATDHLPLLEEELAVPREATDHERRVTVAEAYTRVAPADIPNITQDLLDLSPYYSVINHARSGSIIAHQGKALAPLSGTPAYNFGGGTQFPCYSTHHYLFVGWDVAASGLATPDATLLDRTERFLNEALPSYVDWQISQLQTGFFLDGGVDGTSLLDITAFA